VTGFRARRARVSGHAVAVGLSVVVGLTGCGGGGTGEPRPSTAPSASSGAIPPGSPADLSPTPPLVWSPVRERGDLAVFRGTARVDPHDTAVGWVDVEHVSFSSSRHSGGDVQMGWSIELAARPPLGADLEPGRLIAYGLVLDTNSDGGADYVVGIDNDAPERGDFHVWLTDLATGETDEQIGPPYGFPMDFVHPDEADPGSRARGVALFFLPRSAPEGLNPETVRWYAWASTTRGGEVVALDYAPDAGWMTRP